MYKTSLYLFSCLMFLHIHSVFASTPKTIPPNLLGDFTMDGQIPISYQYHDDKAFGSIFYPSEFFVDGIAKAQHKVRGYFGETDDHLYRVLDDMAPFINGKKVALIGSCNGWYECVLLSRGAELVVIDPRLITTHEEKLTYVTPKNFTENPQKFDLVISLQNIPHDGLGRYDDVIDSDGDLKSIEGYRNMLTANGKLILAIPVGPDQIIWNAHRIYGEKRLKLLLKGWKVVRYYGFTSEHVFQGVKYRPIFLLQNK